jgi:hypothetical protein
MQERIHTAFENILIAALIWTHNPEAVRRDKLLRKRRPVWMSRERLLQRYGTQSMRSSSCLPVWATAAASYPYRKSF